MKLEQGETLVIASHNKGKVAEILELLAPFGIDVVGAGDLGLPEPEENGQSFAENAQIKAAAAASATGKKALSDDSGLCVAALGGAPGIFSARWAGPTKNFSAAMARIEAELSLQKGGSLAKFVCALALAAPDGTSQTFIGEVTGHLEFPPRGKNGFGYDPIFVADGMTQTFGEIDPDEKHAISHRARAFATFSKAVLST